MEPADHLAAEQSQSPWKKGENIYWLLSREQSLQNTETAEDSPYQQCPNRDHLHSDLHRRKRHEGLPPTNKIGSQERLFYNSGKEQLYCCITIKTTQHRNILYSSTLFLNIYVKQEDSQNDFQAVLFSGLAGS